MYLQADRLLGDALVVAHGALRLTQYLLPDPVKVIEAFACMDTPSSRRALDRFRPQERVSL